MTSLNDAYKLEQIGEVWNIWENGRLLFSTTDKPKAHAMLFNLKQGSGFEGNSPIFIEENS